ncbi:MAG: aspartate/glutamate racemase family protein, partial [Tissierellia bacterium]|nr:aspartate/glutamate racemase family protein [Tissierellia bacterium]
QVLIIACNTAHYYLEDLEKEVDVPFLSILDATLKEVERQGAKKISLLATKGTYKTALYQNKCEQRSILCLEPEEEDKNLLMEVIYDVKAGKTHEHLDRMKAFLDREMEKGVELFILACTELPIYFAYNSINAPVLDPTLALALETIGYAGAEVV